nr:helix-turn-helix domain-containing protein [uncultured Duganella sp.]
MNATEASPAAVAVIRANTADVQRNERFDFWQDIVCSNLIDLQYAVDDDDQFDARFCGLKMGGLNIATIAATAHRATRPSSRCARGPSAERASLIFNFVLDGEVAAEQDGRRVILGNGDGIVCDAERPYTFSFTRPVKVAALQLPRDALPYSIACVERITATSFNAASGVTPIVFGYLNTLAHSTPQLIANNAARIAGNFMELLSTMLADVIQTAPLPLSEYRGSTLIRVKDFIERHLADMDLDPAMVGHGLKLSPRYINQLFEAEQTSLSRYIWRRRLERSAAALRDPALRCRSISTIAMNNGFNDLSHFSKTFRQRFDLSPREYRITHA